MDIQIDAHEIIEKLERKLGQKDRALAIMEITIEKLQDELNTYKQESTLELK